MSGDSCIDHSIIIDVLYGIPDLHLCFMNTGTLSPDFWWLLRFFSCLPSRYVTGTCGYSRFWWEIKLWRLSQEICIINHLMSIYLHLREGKSQLNTWIVCSPCVFEQKAHNIQEESTNYATERCDKNLITYMKKKFSLRPMRARWRKVTRFWKFVVYCVIKTLWCGYVMTNFYYTIQNLYTSIPCQHLFWFEYSV